MSHRQNLKPLLQARSVAVVGLSRPGRFGGQLYANLRDFGYQGKIYGVNPRYTTLYDQPCYPSLRDLPERPDCAVLAVPNQRLLDVFTEAAELEIPAAVIFASAYSETANGQPGLQTRLTELAHRHNIAVCGPNCMGFFSLGSRLTLSGYESLPHLPSGSVAMISHSGSMWDALLQNNRHIYFNYAISSGNEMVTTVADYMQFALTDPSTRVIALFLETVRDPHTFVAALAEAAERDIPVVVLKIGRSRRGAQLAQAHSGAIAGEDGAYEAIFAYYGVRRVKSPDEMMNTLELFATGMRATTRYISAVLDSGGERGLLVDLAEAEGIDFAPISETTTARLTEVLEPGLDPVNPLDAWGTGNDYQQIYQNALRILDDDPATGLNLFAVDLCSAEDFSLSYFHVATTMQPQLSKPLVMLMHLTAAAGPAQVARMRQAGIPVLMDTETGLRAVRHLLEYSQYQRRRAEQIIRPEPALREWPAPAIRRLLRAQLAQAEGSLDEYAGKQLLQAYGLSTAPEIVATSLAEALQAAEQLGYPVVLKTAAGILHKSESGGVRLNLLNAEQLTTAYRDVEARLGPRVLVQQMVSGGVELILGMVHDRQFGPLLLLGMGGIFVEIFKDSRLLALPTRPDIVRETLLSLKGASLLQGARGRSPVNLEAIVEAAMHLTALIADLGDLIAELDINPLIALPDGAVAVDALIIVNQQCNSSGQT